MNNKICDCAMCVSVRASKAQYTVASGKFSITAKLCRLGDLHALAKTASKIKSVKQFRAAQMRMTDKREYPRFVEGQTTEQYVEAYWALNGSAMGLASVWVNRGNARRPLEGEVQRLINGLYELPLGTNPQSTPLFDGVEEAL